MIITIGRQTGSGGHIIARRLAENLGLRFYDKELLDIAAMESGFDKKFFESNDEKHGFFHNFFGMTMHAGHSGMYGDGLVNNKFSQEALFRFQADAIRKAAEEGDCVFVGRCADYILRDFGGLLNVFISANYDDRIRRIVENSKYDTEELAAKRIAAQEKSRSSFYQFYTGKKWGDAASYDLTVNSSCLGLEKTEEYIRSFVFYFFGKDRS